METKYTKKEMKQNYNRGIKDTVKVIGATIGIAAIGYLGLVGTQNEPTKKDYQNANWIESNAIPWNAYMQEKIPHNQFVWDKFQREISKKKSLEGITSFPDLDGDGKIAQ